MPTDECKQTMAEIIKNGPQLGNEAITAQQVSGNRAWEVRAQYRLDAMEGALIALAEQVDRIHSALVEDGKAPVFRNDDTGSGQG
jgi:hypothetical protein